MTRNFVRDQKCGCQLTAHLIAGIGKRTIIAIRKGVARMQHKHRTRSSIREC